MLNPTTTQLLNMPPNSAVQDDEQSMRVDPQRATQLAENLGNVLQRVQKSSGGRKVSNYTYSHKVVIAVVGLVVDE